jgi:hypothetical protein
MSACEVLYEEDHQGRRRACMEHDMRRVWDKPVTNRKEPSVQQSQSQDAPECPGYTQRQRHSDGRAESNHESTKNKPGVPPESEGLLPRCALQDAAAK